MFKFGRGIVANATVFLNLTTVEVRVGDRRVTARWTPEMAQDIQAFVGVDAEAELTALLSQHWAQEIDQSILRSLREVRLSERYVREKFLNFKPFKFGR